MVTPFLLWLSYGGVGSVVPTLPLGPDRLTFRVQPKKMGTNGPGWVFIGYSPDSAPGPETRPLCRLVGRGSPNTLAELEWKPEDHPVRMGSWT